MIPKALAKRGKQRKAIWGAPQEIGKFIEEKMTFSFHFLDTLHPAFRCGKAEEVKDGWFLHLLENLREICRLRRHEFVMQRNHYDLHPHDWSRAQFKYNLPPEWMEQIAESECVQFRLSSSGGRIHGFLIRHTFYVVWLDPHHNLYPDQRFGGTKFYDKPLSPYEELVVEFHRLQQENKELHQLLDAATFPDV